MSRKNKRIVLILFFCLAARLAFFGFFHPWTPEKESGVVLQKDALGYHNLALTMIEHHRFAFSAGDEPNSVRTPLYPVFVAGLYLVFGAKPWLVLLVQILMDTLTCFLLFTALSRLFTTRTGLAAALFYAFDPFLVLYPSTLLSDMLFVFLLVLSLFFFSLARASVQTNRTAAFYGLSGFSVGLATLARPISQYIPIIFVAFLLIVYREKLKEALKYSLAAAGLFLLAVAPWFIRNYAVFGRWALSSSGSHNLLIEYVVPMEVQKRNQHFKTVQHSLLDEVEKNIFGDHREPETMDSFAKASYYRDLAVAYIVRNPERFLRSYVLGVFHTFTHLDTTTFAEKLGFELQTVDIKAYTDIKDLIKAFIAKKGTSGLIAAGLILPYLVVSYLGLALGLVVSWKRLDRTALLWCLLMAGYFIAVTGVAGTARFKIPSIPFYLAFTGTGIAWFLGKIRRKKASPENFEKEQKKG